MRNSPLRLQISNAVLNPSELAKLADGWLQAGEISQHSSSTIATRRLFLNNFLWFLREKKHTECDTHTVRAFLAYVTNGHKEPGGRWGKSHLTKPATSRTVKDYHGCLKAFFNWIVLEERLEASPLERIPTPIDRPDQIQPFTDEQVNTLLLAARSSRHPKRDEALLLFLLDTGVRVSELTGIQFRDLDSSGMRATVEGKGGKTRPVFYGKRTRKALFDYVRNDGNRDDDDPLFMSERGEAFTRWGVAQIVERLAEAAGIQREHCSPHTFRHTFAVSFLRNGGNQMALMALLGHTNIQMTSRYVTLAQADVERQHRQFSPADALKGRGKR